MQIVSGSQLPWLILTENKLILLFYHNCNWFLTYFADDEAEVKKKKKKPTLNEIGHKTQLGSENADSFKKTGHTIRHNVRMPHLDGSSTLKETMVHETKEVTFSCWMLHWLFKLFRGYGGLC